MKFAFTALISVLSLKFSVAQEVDVSSMGSEPVIVNGSPITFGSEYESMNHLELQLFGFFENPVDFLHILHKIAAKNDHWAIQMVDHEVANIFVESIENAEIDFNPLLKAIPAEQVTRFLSNKKGLKEFSELLIRTYCFSKIDNSLHERIKNLLINFSKTQELTPIKLKRFFEDSKINLKFEHDKLEILLKKQNIESVGQFIARGFLNEIKTTHDINLQEYYDRFTPYRDSPLVQKIVKERNANVFEFNSPVYQNLGDFIEDILGFNLRLIENRLRAENFDRLTIPGHNRIVLPLRKNDIPQSPDEWKTFERKLKKLISHYEKKILFDNLKNNNGSISLAGVLQIDTPLTRKGIILVDSPKNKPWVKRNKKFSNVSIEFRKLPFKRAEELEGFIKAFTDHFYNVDWNRLPNFPIVYLETSDTKTLKQKLKKTFSHIIYDNNLVFLWDLKKMFTSKDLPGDLTLEEVDQLAIKSEEAINKAISILSSDITENEKARRIRSLNSQFFIDNENALTKLIRTSKDAKPDPSLLGNLPITKCSIFSY